MRLDVCFLHILPDVSRCIARASKSERADLGSLCHFLEGMFSEPRFARNAHSNRVFLNLWSNSPTTISLDEPHEASATSLFDLLDSLLPEGDIPPTFDGEFISQLGFVVRLHSILYGDAWNERTFRCITSCLSRFWRTIPSGDHAVVYSKVQAFTSNQLQTHPLSALEICCNVIGAEEDPYYPDTFLDCLLDSMNKLLSQQEYEFIRQTLDTLFQHLIEQNPFNQASRTLRTVTDHKRNILTSLIWFVPAALLAVEPQWSVMLASWHQLLRIEDPDSDQSSESGGDNEDLSNQQALVDLLERRLRLATVFSANRGRSQTLQGTSSYTP